MTNASHAIGAPANSSTAMRCGKFSTRPWWADAVMRVVHGVWPTKRAANIVACAGIKPRAAEYMLAERTVPSSDALVGLLRSGDVGPQLLDALLGDLDWYQYRRNLQRLGELDQERATRQAALDAFTSKHKTRR